MKFIIILFAISTINLFAADTFYYQGGKYELNQTSESPVKVAGLTWFGPSSTLFWETGISQNTRGMFGIELNAVHGEKNVQLLPTHVESGATYTPKTWVNTTDAYTNFKANIRVGAIVKNPTDMSSDRLLKITDSEIVTVVTNPKTNAVKEFSAPLDISKTKLGAWKVDEYKDMKSSAKYVEPSGLGLPKETMGAIGDSIAKFSKAEKVNSSDLDAKILIRMKLQNKKGEMFTEDYLLSANNTDNLSLLSLRGILNSIGGYSAARALNEAVGNKSNIQINESTQLKSNTLNEVDTFVGSEEAAAVKSK